MRARRLCIGGSLIGSIKETQEMLDLCGEKNITCDVEVRCSGSAGVNLNMTLCLLISNWHVGVHVFSGLAHTLKDVLLNLHCIGGCRWCGVHPSQLRLHTVTNSINQSSTP